MLDTFDAVAFRQKLAGLCDVTGGESAFSEQCKANACDIVELLAIAFNRDQLEATTLWDRINSGLRKAIEESPPGDMTGFLSVALEHVLAEPNRLIGHDRAALLQSRLYAVSQDECTATTRYLAKHLLPTIVLGRAQYEENRPEAAKAKKGKVPA